MSPIIRTALASDFTGILDLQACNLYSNLAATALPGGFVTTPFSSELLRLLLLQNGVFVAESEQQIIGYLLAGDWKFFSQWEIFKVMIDRMSKLRFQNRELTVDNSFQYGPICIDQSSRGSQIFPELFDLMRSSFAPKFLVGVTFINKINERSFAAHTRKLNLEIIDEFEFNGNSFYTLAFLTAT
ncbi:MAG: GNAT family acetyltransferase [Chamaesiphon sp.]|nr:GNAT family acetyltransferase [Chamaesiphon sp.]